MDARLLGINPSAADPIYRQIVEQVRRLIGSGQLRPGDALPSVREVAATHAINPMTVSKAYSLLEAEGELERLRGKGMVIAAQATRLHSQAARMALVEPVLRTLADHARELDIPAERLAARLRILMEEDPQ